MGSERLALKNMGGETTEAWRAVLDDLVDRGLRRRRAFLIVDRAPGLEKAIAAVGVPVQRGTDHKHRNLLAHAPERLHDEISADYNDMIYAATPEEIAARRKAFIRKWRLCHGAVALEEAGDRLFTFTPCHRPSGAASRTTNAIERLHEEVLKRPIKAQTVLPSADTAAMLFWALLASGQINIRRSTAGTRSLTNPLINQLTSPLDQTASSYRRLRRANSNHMPSDTSLQELDRSSLEPFLTLTDLHTYRLTFRQLIQPTAAERRRVDENILFAPILRYETKSLLDVVPFN